MPTPPPTSFFLRAEPMATGNAHVIRRSGPMCPRCKTRKHASVGRSSKAKAAKQRLTLIAMRHRPPRPWRGPVALSVVFVMPIPKSFLKWQRECALAGLIEPTARGSGDRDNMHKLLGDALEAAQFYVDDSQITWGPVGKRYGEVPGYEVEVTYRPMPPKSAAEGRAALAALQAVGAQTAELDPAAPTLTEDDVSGP